MGDAPTFVRPVEGLNGFVDVVDVIHIHNIALPGELVNFVVEDTDAFSKDFVAAHFVNGFYLTGFVIGDSQRGIFIITSPFIHFAIVQLQTLSVSACIVWMLGQYIKRNVSRSWYA